jgi:inhibitor of KinA sporulation pathway (predicted exonuclease)
MDYKSFEHYRGIDDARNIAKLLPYIFGDLTFSR